MDNISKRLLISGLTPQITQEDLLRRLSSFGKVISLDGIGKLDALGRPRPFAFATLETSKGQLARCLNLLSGSTWKGAKLRIGEAKPDFAERIRKEREEAESPDSLHPKKKRRRIMRGCVGIHATDMTPVSPSNVAQRSGWRTTPLGRLLRPMRMRPLRPLNTSSSLLNNSGSGSTSTSTKKLAKKRRQRPPLTRARRRLLDPEFWGAEYLKGVMLEGTTNVVADKVSKQIPGSSKNGEEDDRPPKIRNRRSASPALHDIPPKEPSQPKDTAKISPVISDLAKEATHNLSLLKTLFADDEKDWGGAESLSDIDIPAEEIIPVENTKEIDGNNEKDDESDLKDASLGGQDSASEREVSATVTVEDDDDNESALPSDIPATDPAPPPPPPKQATVQTTKLKDMFAPRAEEAGYSLLGNLDLDLELDDMPEVIAPTYTHPEPTAPYPSHNTSSYPSHNIAQHRTFTLPTIDPTKPLFFPPSLLPQSNISYKPTLDVLYLLNTTQTSQNGRPFCRTEDEDAIRARWEERKVELTRDWKRRHREAVKSARRRGGLQD